MNRNRPVVDKLGLVFCGALLGTLAGCTTYVEQPRARGGYYEEQPRPPAVYAPPPAVEVEASYVGIRTESDFYEPLNPYGQWVVVGSYGRCWRPARVDPDWRPYCNGYWQRCDAGWYWASDEPWGWATYHYGRWDFNPQYGWFWVPQTQWAPAWVSWHQGGGYVGWAPLYPSARVGRSGFVEVDVRVISPRAYVFVEERRFLEPVRPTTVVVNNTTIINKTVNITKIKVVNKTVINEGPQTEVIEQVSGRKVQAVQVRELRRKAEAEAVAKHGTPTPTIEKKERKDQAPDRSEAEPVEKKAVVAQAPRQVEQPDVTTVKTDAPARKKEVRETDEQKRDTKSARDEEKRERKDTQQQAESEKGKAVPVTMETKPEADRRPAIKEPTEQKAEKLTEKEKKRAKELEKQAQRVAARRVKEEQAVSKQGGTNTVDKVHKKNVEEKRADEQQTPPGQPAVPPQASQ